MQVLAPTGYVLMTALSTPAPPTTTPTPTPELRDAGELLLLVRWHTQRVVKGNADISGRRLVLRGNYTAVLFLWVPGGQRFAAINAPETDSTPKVSLVEPSRGRASYSDSASTRGCRGRDVQPGNGIAAIE